MMPDNPCDWAKWEREHLETIDIVQPVNELGKEYSPSTEEFILNMCHSNSVFRHDDLLGESDFYLFFNREAFIDAVQIMFSAVTKQMPNEILLPSLDDFLTRRNQEQPNQELSDVSKQQPEPTAKTRNKQAEIIAALAIMYTKKDGTQPYEMAATIRQAWQMQADQLGNPPDKNTLAKYIQQGLERLQS